MRVENLATLSIYSITDFFVYCNGHIIQYTYIQTFLCTMKCKVYRKL